MYVTILGRQPALGMAELEHFYGAEKTQWFSDISARVNTDVFSISRFGGTQKAGKIVLELPYGDWHRVSTKIIQSYANSWSRFEGKITLGISAYGFDASPREIQKTGIVLKQKLKQTKTSIRLIPNNEMALNSATSHHNKLGLADNKVELIAIRARSGRVIIAESVGAQNITAYTKRDQERPKRDAFVGMLPPKLAQLMVNLATSYPIKKDQRILDPFCGTGVVLQEAALMGYSVYGTDIADKMVDYSRVNLEWLADLYGHGIDATIEQGDAIDTMWQQPIDAVVCESYLGQPFSAPPSSIKLDQVRKNCDHIITDFLKNIGGQIAPNTPLCIAIPAWRDSSGKFQHLSLINQLKTLGFMQYEFKNIKTDELLYYRENQVVARELLVLVKT